MCKLVAKASRIIELVQNRATDTVAGLAMQTLSRDSHLAKHGLGTDFMFL